MEARTNNQTEEHMQILDFVMADPEIQKIRQVLQEKQFHLVKVTLSGLLMPFVTILLMHFILHKTFAPFLLMF